MRLGHPELWLKIALGGALAVVVALLIAGYFLRLRRLARLGSAAATATTVRSRTPGLGAVRGVLYVLGAAGVLFALLRPQHGGREQIVRQFGLDVVIAVDFSRSMLAQDVSPSRIGKVRMEIDRLLDDLEGNRIGSVAFAGDAIGFPLSTDTAIVNTFFRNFDPATMEPPGTGIGRAIRKAQRLLEQVDRRRTKEGEQAPPSDDRARIVILFTDGEDHEGDPIEAARTIESTVGARVFVAAVGEMGPSPIPMTDPVTGEHYLHRTASGEIVMSEITPQVEETLRTVASSRDPNDPDAADRHFYRLPAGGSVARSIAADVRRLRRSEMEARRVTLYDELFWIPLLPAAVLLAAEAALPVGFQRRRRRKKT